jgi:hypothetical protein
MTNAGNTDNNCFGWFNLFNKNNVEFVTESDATLIVSLDARLKMKNTAL